MHEFSYWHGRDVSAGVLRLLINSGADINAISKDGAALDIILDNSLGEYNPIKTEAFHLLNDLGAKVIKNDAWLDKYNNDYKES